jgi:hypothetical protein
LPAAGAVNAVAAGAPNFLRPPFGINMVQVNQATGTNLAMAMNVASATAGTTSNPLQQASLQTPTASTNQSSMFSSISGIFAPLGGYMNPSPSSQSMSTQSPSTAYKTPQKSTYQYREDTPNLINAAQRKADEAMRRARSKQLNTTISIIYFDLSFCGVDLDDMMGF